LGTNTRPVVWIEDQKYGVTSWVVYKDYVYYNVNVTADCPCSSANWVKYGKASTVVIAEGTQTAPIEW